MLNGERQQNDTLHNQGKHDDKKHDQESPEFVMLSCIQLDSAGLSPILNQFI